MDISRLSPRQLLELHAKIESELRVQQILHTANNPTGDLAEHLFCTAFDWEPARNSQAHYDAIGPNGEKYQIEGRRITSSNRSRQLSAIRNLEGAQNFDVLAGLLFKEDYSVERAALIPHAVLLSLVKEQRHIAFQQHTSSYIFLLVNDIWEIPGVQDVTDKLRKVWH
jgi:hypothetical protein